MYLKQEGACNQTGIPFVLSYKSGVSNPWRPSIDRIDATKGYTQGNVQLVCQIYNLAKHTWTDADVQDFATWLIKNKGEK